MIRTALVAAATLLMANFASAPLAPANAQACHTDKKAGYQACTTACSRGSTRERRAEIQACQHKCFEDKCR